MCQSREIDHEGVAKEADQLKHDNHYPANYKLIDITNEFL